MTDYLVDTHVLLWSWHDPERLNKSHLDILESGNATFFVSVASIWEISIKAALGKVSTVDRITETIGITGFQILPILPKHAEAVRHLPKLHRDPFDRLLVAQAHLEELVLATSDQNIRRYDVKCI